MVNLSSIYHDRFTKLHAVTNNYSKATLLDKLIYWWQISKYTLDDDQIWFTRSIDQIADDSQISKRSVERYLCEFEKNGLIYKVNRLFMKKHLYIRITDKLLAIIGKTPLMNEKKEDFFITDQSVKANTFGGSSAEDNVGVKTRTDIKEIALKQECSSVLNHFGVIDSANLAVSIYKDKDSNSVNNSTVSQSDIVNNSETKQITEKNSPYPNYPIEQVIGERITERFKNYIKGTIVNLQTQHNVVLSNPDQLFAEVVFSVMNVENQFPGVTDNHHRLNLIAKLLREKKWRTPKGFYNHWDVGQVFKLKLEKQEKKQQQLKQDERNASEVLYSEPNKMSYGCHAPNVSSSVKSHQSQAHINAIKIEHREILSLISTETRYLKEMEARFLKTKDEVSERIIQSTGIKLAKLYEKLDALYKQLKLEEAA